MINSFDIVCFSISRTDSGISSPGFSLAKEFAKTHRVFYIEHPFTIKDIATGWNTEAVQSRKHSWFGDRLPIRIDPSGVIVVTPPLAMPVNFLPPGRLYDKASSSNDKKLFDLLRAIRKEYSVQRFLFINFFDPFYFRDFPDDIKPFMTVYQSMDDIAEVPYTARHGVRLEKAWIKKATFTVCTSTGLLKQHAVGNDNIHLVPNGVDDTIFGNSESLAAPIELREQNKPVIGYIGSIEYRMDFNLMISAARALPDMDFVFIGPVGEVDKEYQALANLDNVTFTGARPQQSLPAYLQHFSVVCIPFKCNKLTANIYPLKVNEYLMAGKPVVSTAFSPDIISFAPEVYIAYNGQEFIDQLCVAVAEPPGRESSRKARASLNTWAHRAAEFFRLVEIYATRLSNK